MPLGPNHSVSCEKVDVIVGRSEHAVDKECLRSEHAVNSPATHTLFASKRARANAFLCFHCDSGRSWFDGYLPKNKFCASL